MNESVKKDLIRAATLAFKNGGSAIGAVKRVAGWKVIKLHPYQISEIILAASEILSNCKMDCKEDSRTEAAFAIYDGDRNE